ncbi:alpha/beta hydrolase-fold protein [Conexibacter sp. SYSU D00693]|uniref:alpha/beta hydrolase-fold protein n=1 Tax=Conexibacter sp. SYSU D00693 TaxID=2812560 RepID=UPI00196B5CA4|nr:alpha/beta hydrolase-fold protein [Conexibacter sp. SYSU D00693]
MVLVVALATLALPAVAAADAPNVVSGNGITVSGWRWITTRTLEVDIATAKVAPVAVNGPHRVRITLPTGYAANPTVRYPVLYLLHGGAGGNAAQWTSGGGAVEAITANRPVITVMPDGGKVGWYTNWVNQSQGAQAWADFHLTQLIPWVDANLRTVASKAGRAIAGLSMGGFGAVRYAQDRPDLFTYVASFSGAVDLGDSGTRTVVTEQAAQNGFNAYGPFGNPFWPFDGTWNALNPLGRAARLQGVGVALYAGSGIHDADVLEGTMAAAASRMHGALDAAGVPHVFWNYGRPGPSVPYGCDGGHNFSCWNFALNDAMPRMMAALQTPPGTNPGNLVSDGDFETPGLGPWVCAGTCGADHGAGLARTGAGNGWVRGTSGWHDLHQTISVTPGRTYTVSGWIRTSATNANGFFGLRTPGGQVVGEQRFTRLDGYTKVSATVSSGSSSSLVVFAGLWADRDTWAQVDDVTVVAS